MLMDYYAYLKTHGYKARGMEGKVQSSKQFMGYLEETAMLPGDITMKQAGIYREYLAALTCKGKTRYTPETINWKLSHLKHFYSYLVSRGIVLMNSFVNVERMRESKKVIKNVYTIKQMKRLLSGIQVESLLDFKFKVVVELLYATGMRIAELEQLTTKDIDVKEGWLKVHDNKGGYNRRMPLTTCARQLLGLYLLGAKENLFRGRKPRTLNVWINDRLKRLTKSLNLPAISCHGFRHTLATQLLKAGAGIREVQEFLGHKCIKNTEVYTRILVEDLKRIVNKNHPREKRK
jgi:site-specific recombinase XerD